MCSGPGSIFFSYRYDDDRYARMPPIRNCRFTEERFAALVEARCRWVRQQLSLPHRKRPAACFISEWAVGPTSMGRALLGGPMGPRRLQSNRGPGLNSKIGVARALRL